MIRDLAIYLPVFISFFWAAVFFSTAGHKNSHKLYLGIFMLCTFFLFISHAVYFQRATEVMPLFDSIYVFTSLSVFPLYYWYIKVITVETEVNLKNLLMLLPAAGFGLVSACTYTIMTDDQRANYTRFLLSGDRSVLQTRAEFVLYGSYLVSRFVYVVQIIWFTLRGRQLTLTYNEKISNFYSNTTDKSIVWVKLLLYSFFITSVVSILFNILGRQYFIDSKYLLLVPSIILSLLVFIIGLQGNMQNYSIREMEHDSIESTVLNLKDINRGLLRQNLVRLFEQDHIYKVPDLKITQVAAALNTNRTYVSGLINSEFSCSFNEYVNRFRIARARQLLADESFKNFTLHSIAEESGFGSVSTLTRTFREFEETTPGKFREMLKLHEKNLQGGNP